MLNTLTKEQHCRICDQWVLSVLARYRMANGAVCVSYACPNTRYNKRHFISSWIRHDQLRIQGIDIDSLALIVDNATVNCSVIGCCELGSEWHHFAPYSVFREHANDWPVLPLCRRHHLEWHRKMMQLPSKFETVRDKVMRTHAGLFRRLAEEEDD